MTEEEARSRVAHDVPRETLEKLDCLVALVSEESGRQNLISPASLQVIWARHILDSAQLVWLADGKKGSWMDIGSGGGFPGLVVALLRADPTILVEPRSKRAAFLHDAAGRLAIAERTTVVASKVETMSFDDPAAIVSARAVASLGALFEMAMPRTSPETLWLLPKGRSAAMEVAEAQRHWQGEMRLASSLSDPESAIVVARGIRRKRA